MPFVPVQSDDAMYDKFQKRQVLVWSFLIFMALVMTVFLLYISYQVMKTSNENGSASVGATSIVTPVSNLSASSVEPQNDNYLLYGEFAPEDKKYRIYKVFYANYAKEELFSFPWSDASSQPSFSRYGKDIAVFPDVNKGFLISREGDVVPTNEFMPPDRHFSVSPDNKLMFYFNYLSSVGTTALTLRDVEKNKDVFFWPVSSPASQVCDFAGWSQDNAKAYCVSRKGGVASVKAFDAKSRTFSVILSQSGVADAKYYPEKNMLLAATPDAVLAVDAATKERRTIAGMPPGFSPENVFLTPDGSRVLFTAASGAGASRETTIYSIAFDGSDKRTLTGEKNARLVSVAQNSKSVLFESMNDLKMLTRHYFIAAIDGSASVEAYAVNAGISIPQFIGWFFDGQE